MKGHTLGVPTWIWLATLVGAIVAVIPLTAIGVLSRDTWFDAVVVVALAVCVVAGYHAVRSVASRSEPGDWYVSLRDESQAPEVLDFRVVRLERDLQDAVTGSTPHDRLRPVLASAARGRLRDRHGIDTLAPDGLDAAREVLGADAVAYLAGPGFDLPDTGGPSPRAPRPPRPQTIETIVRRLEEMT